LNQSTSVIAVLIVIGIISKLWKFIAVLVICIIIGYVFKIIDSIFNAVENRNKKIVRNGENQMTGYVNENNQPENSHDSKIEIYYNKLGYKTRYFCGSINPLGEWDIFKFNIGDIDSFYGHSSMVPGDILVLIVGKQDPRVISGAYAILQCTSDIYHEEESGKMRIRVNAKCIYHSGKKPFISRRALENYIHFPIRVPILAKNNVENFAKLIEENLYNPLPDFTGKGKI
jgi:hypothetical protein